MIDSWNICEHYVCTFILILFICLCWFFIYTRLFWFLLLAVGQLYWHSTIIYFLKKLNKSKNLWRIVEQSHNEHTWVVWVECILTMFVKHKGGNINCNVILLSYYQRKLSIDIKSGLCTLSFHLSSLLLCCGGWALEQRSKSGTREGEEDRGYWWGQYSGISCIANTTHNKPKKMSLF